MLGVVLGVVMMLMGVVFWVKEIFDENYVFLSGYVKWL